jgi:hypothetical protein
MMKGDSIMFENATGAAVLAAADLDRARSFYERRSSTDWAGYR